jgi:acyl-[acyl-carrier-protein]-phospholipid O-acyltransferase/long-chain-fatty-acid--[acyl-carrier-protein] ligase
MRLAIETGDESRLMIQSDLPSQSGAAQAPGLASAGFCGLLLTQLLGAANDNMFRLLAIGIGSEYVAANRSSLVVSVGLACFTLPYLLLASPAGYLADRFSKRSVIVACKMAEIVIMLMAVGAILAEQLYLLFGVLALMGAQSALFGPAKLGSIPEMLHSGKISAANGLMGLVTVVATVLGVVAGNYLYDATQPRGLSDTWIAAAALVGTAVVGTLTSLMIPRLPTGNTGLRFPWNPFRQTWLDLKALGSNRALVRVALGSTFFWSLGALAQSNILEFGKEGGLVQKDTSPMLAALVVGVGMGSVLAGIWSGGKVELGILPLGAGGVALSSMLLFTVDPQLASVDAGWTAAQGWSCVWLLLLGVSAGLFDVPLASYLQHRSPPESRGAILAASNFLIFSGILLSAGLYYILRAPLAGDGGPLLTAHQIFLLAGVFTLPVLAYILWLLPGASIRFVVWLASHTLYRVRVLGREHLPERGGALLVCNHVTWIDGILLLLASSRPIRIIAWSRYVDVWGVRWLAKTMGVIPISPGKRSVMQTLEAAKFALAQGELVCIFPEGGLTRTGVLQRFKPGLLALASAEDIPVIPVFLDELWGSIFSFRGGRFFWKKPRHWPYPVSIWFGPALRHVTDTAQVHRAVEALGVRAVQERMVREMVLPRLFLRMCRRRFFAPKIADSSGAELSGGKMLLAALALRRALVNKLLAPDEKYVGLLLPPSVGATVSNIALVLAHRVGVNLNYTVSSEVMNSCIRQCGIRRVLASRRLMEKINLSIDAEIVYMEDFRSRVSVRDKAIAAMQSVLPLAILERMLGLMRIKPHDLLTVIFTSGSTGEPKGVMLTHANVSSNIEAMDELVNLKASDVAIGVLPFFHSYGYTATLWTVLAFDPKGVYHFNPLDAGQVGKLCKQHRGTLLMATPTFLRSYLKRCEPDQLSSLNVVFASAEKLPKELSDAFETKFGVRPMEAYGATELSPLVAVNVPPSRSNNADQIMAKEGTVGRPIPGITAKIVNPESGEDLASGAAGMLLIKGPNVMKGYLHRPDLTEKVIRDGWYITGDIARIDDDGFIQITGRESRFSKIGGEMVPHLKIEETLHKLLGLGEEDLSVAVTAVPDARKGERLIVFHLPISKAPQQICRELQEAGLPNIWIPSPDSFCQVESIPVLGTGKLDLKGLKDLAHERVGTPAERASKASA